MKRKNVELFWEHPGRYIFRLFVVVTVGCTLLTIMPKWFNTICTILLILFLIKKTKDFERNEKKKNRKKFSNINKNSVV